MNADILDLASDLVARAKRFGATAADALAADGRSIEIELRDGHIEKLEQAESREAGLRVFVGQSSAIVSGSALDGASLARLAQSAVAMARAAPPDPFAGLAPPELLSQAAPDLDLAASELPDAETLKAMALAAEAGAMAVKGVTKSGGAGASVSDRSFAIAGSNGLAGRYRKTGIGMSATAIAGEGTGMERDYDFSSALHPEDLRDPYAVGQSAGERAVKRLNPRKAKSQSVPVIFDRRLASSLAGHLIGAVLGSAIARGTSFLKDALGTQIFPAAISILDDPFRIRGLASRPFDGEGLSGARRHIVKDGVLQTWLLDLRSARQLGLAPTGHAGRSLSGPPGPSSTNVHLEPGTADKEALIGGVKSGLYVTELIGMGVNPVTGDYSRGASGLWIDNGALAYPVSEITIAGNLKDMFAGLIAADDLEFRMAVNAPTCLIEGMTIAGA